MIGVLCLCIVFSLVLAHPYNHRYKPQRAVMFGGYYGHPYGRSDFIPEGSMTAFASGDTISTNSFVGEDATELEGGIEVTTQRIIRSKEENEESGISEDGSSPSENNKRIPKKKKPTNPSKEEEDADDNEENWPFSLGRSGAPNYNAFFPIMIGLPGGRSRSSNNDGEDAGGFLPGSSTAIANSFSTGRGGVATSHATSFGDPYLTEMFKNRRANKNDSRNQ